jgi:alpha-1,3-mannosyltransferase
MLSVVHICTDFWPSKGGIQQFVRELAARSATAGVRVTVLCFDRVKGFPGRLPVEDHMDGFDVRRIPFLDFTYYKPAAIPLSVLKSHDLVHVHGIGAPLDFVALTRWLHKRPIIVSTHGGIFHTPALAGVKQLYFRNVARRALRRVDVVAACSKSDATLFATVTPRVQLLENAVAVQPFLALRMDDKQRGRCLYVGRLSDNKGIDLLLRVAAVANAHVGNFALRLVGPDVEHKRARYESLAGTLGISERVEFVGEVSHEALLQEYRRAEMFVSASQYEGFGLAAVEAKAAGCKLLLHDNEAFRHAFGLDSAATLVDFRHTDTAARALATLLHTRANDDLDAKRSDVRKYSWESKMLEWSDLYERVRSGTLRARERAFDS